MVPNFLMLGQMRLVLAPPPLVLVVSRETFGPSSNEYLLKMLCEGKTCYRLVDAGRRYLNQTGANAM